jgi:hypothetical protein
MADPATIIGTNSAIPDFAVFAGNFMSTAYGLYSSTSGNTEENDKIEDVTRKMTGLLGDLQVPVNTVFQSTQEKTMVQLAVHCHGTGEKILSLLTKTKTMKTHSVHECIRATTATVWTKNVIEGLRHELQLCMILLNLHLVTIFRSVTLSRRFTGLLLNEF